MNNTFLKVKKFRYLSEINEKILLKDMKNYDIYGDVVYPCDVIELRDILEDKNIFRVDDLLLFSVRFANKYFRRYPIFLVLNEKDIDYSKKEYGAVIDFNVPDLNIRNTIKHIVINEPLSKEVKNNINVIIKETVGKEIPVFVSNSVPGISSNPDLMRKK